MSKPKYDSSVARMAGNIAAGLAPGAFLDHWSIAAEQDLARRCVSLARAIVAEVQRTEPAVVPDVCGLKGYRPSGIEAFCSHPQGHAGMCNLGLPVRP